MLIDCDYSTSMELPASCSTTSRSGFTLIEMSIVLVIIGLIVGGIMVGRDLIEAAEIRSVISDVEKFGTAEHTFALKYNCMPGDCPNAVALLGAANDGNGNGQIDVAYSEVYGFWQQLALAKLIPGSYTGQAVSADYYGWHVGGVNAPAAKIPNVVYMAGWDFNGSDAPECYFPGHYTHEFIAGTSAVGDGTYNVPYEPAFYTEQAQAIDTKMDDGLPGSGQVIGNMYTGCWFSAQCTVAVSGVSQYNLTYKQPACAMFFNQAY